MIALLLATLLSQDFFGDGVINPGGTTLYLTAPEGGIDVVDAASGKVVKHFETSGRPISLLGEKLVVESLDKRSAVLRVLDLNGDVLFTSMPVEFPDWATTEGGVAGRSFRSRARADKTSVHYDWFARTHAVGGIGLPVKPDGRPGGESASERVSIDLRTYEVLRGPIPEERGNPIVIAGDGTRLEAGGRVYTLAVKQDQVDGKLRDSRTLKSDAGWTRALTPRYHALTKLRP